MPKAKRLFLIGREADDYAGPMSSTGQVKGKGERDEGEG